MDACVYNLIGNCWYYITNPPFKDSHRFSWSFISVAVMIACSIAPSNSIYNPQEWNRYYLSYFWKPSYLFGYHMLSKWYSILTSASMWHRDSSSWFENRGVNMRHDFYLFTIDFLITMNTGHQNTHPPKNYRSRPTYEHQMVLIINLNS